MAATRHLLLRFRENNEAQKNSDRSGLAKSLTNDHVHPLGADGVQPVWRIASMALSGTISDWILPRWPPNGGSRNAPWTRLTGGTCIVARLPDSSLNVFSCLDRQPFMQRPGSGQLPSYKRWPIRHGRSFGCLRLPDCRTLIEQIFRDLAPRLTVCICDKHGFPAP